MLRTAREKAPELDWRLGDLATIELNRAFDCVVMAGNVMLFVAPGTEAAVVANVARHLAEDGLLVAGFQVSRTRFSLAAYDRCATDAGLILVDRWSTWDRESWRPDSTYAVSVHRCGRNARKAE
jgi:hypothetical protein